MRAPISVLLRAFLMAPLLAAGGFGTALAKPVPNVFDHKDWIGVCDNTLRCTVMGLAPDDGDSRAFIAITRDGEPFASTVLKIVLYSDANIASGPVHLKAPGFEAEAPGRWDDDSIVATTKDPALIANLARLASSDAKALDVSIAKAKASLSLSGAAAALVWMDDRQGRLGSVTALTRKGPKPVSALHSPPPPPAYAAAPKGSATEIKTAAFPKALLMRPELKDCDKDQLARTDARAAWRLGPDLVLWSAPCQLGAYNLVSDFFFSDAKGGAIRPAPIPFVPTPDNTEPGANPPFSLLNADFDPKTLILSDFEKGRGLGDCGDLGRYVWDGHAFQVLEYDIMPECRGVTAEGWPALVRARLK